MVEFTRVRTRLKKIYLVRVAYSKLIFLNFFVVSLVSEFFGRLSKHDFFERWLNFITNDRLGDVDFCRRVNSCVIRHNKKEISDTELIEEVKILIRKLIARQSVGSKIADIASQSSSDEVYAASLIKCFGYGFRRKWMLQAFPMPAGCSHGLHTHVGLVSCMTILRGKVFAELFDASGVVKPGFTEIFGTNPRSVELRSGDFIEVVGCKGNIHSFSASENAIAINFNLVEIPLSSFLKGKINSMRVYLTKAPLERQSHKNAGFIRFAAEYSFRND